MTNVITRKEEDVQDPPLIQFLFNDSRAGWLWLNSVLPKLSNPKWVEIGEALQGFGLNAVKISEVGRPPITFN